MVISTGRRRMARDDEQCAQERAPARGWEERRRYWRERRGRDWHGSPPDWRGRPGLIFVRFAAMFGLFALLLLGGLALFIFCLLYTSPSPRDRTRSRMPSSS